MRTLKCISYSLAFLQNLCAVVLPQPRWSWLCSFPQKKVKMRVMHGNSFICFWFVVLVILKVLRLRRCCLSFGRFLCVYDFMGRATAATTAYSPTDVSVASSYLIRAPPCLAGNSYAHASPSPAIRNSRRRCISFRCSIPFLCDGEMLS